jgi:hypothetical protein
MNRYALIHRLHWPAILLLIGVLALLYQTGVISYFWGYFWPLLLIVIGVLLLAERAVLAAEGYPGYPAANYAGAETPQPGHGDQAAGSAETALVPKRSQGFENDVNGGQR